MTDWSKLLDGRGTQREVELSGALYFADLMHTHYSGLVEEKLAFELEDWIQDAFPLPPPPKSK